MPHSNDSSTNLSRAGSGLSLSVLGLYTLIRNKFAHLCII
jgi:hypothetical protein